MGKLSFFVGFGAGYVLGAKAGKQRYEQIKQRTNDVWGHPQVQDKVGTVSDQVKTSAPKVAAAASSAALKAAGQAVKAAPGPIGGRADDDLPDTIHRGTDGNLHADTSGFGPGGERLP